MTPTGLPTPSPAGASAPGAQLPGSGAAALTAEQGGDFLALIAQLVDATSATPVPGVEPSAQLVAPKDAGLCDEAQREAADVQDMASFLQLPLPWLPLESAITSAEVASETPAMAAKTVELVAGARPELMNELVATEESDGIDTAVPEELAHVPSASTHTTQSHSLETPEAVVPQPVRTPVGAPAWADELGSRLTFMVEHGRHTASLRLSPEHLGPLEINIVVQDDQASVWFGATHADTRAAIEHALPRLRELFASQGLSLADTGVFHEAPREQAQQAPGAPTAAEPESADREGAVAARVRLGLVDAYA